MNPVNETPGLMCPFQNEIPCFPQLFLAEVGERVLYNFVVFGWKLDLMRVLFFGNGHRVCVVSCSRKVIRSLNAHRETPLTLLALRFTCCGRVGVLWIS